MPTIKGPIKIGGKDGKSAVDFIKEGTVKLPFTATGWSSTRNSDLVTGSVAKVEEPVAAQPVVKKEIRRRK